MIGARQVTITAMVILALFGCDQGSTSATSTTKSPSTTRTFTGMGQVLYCDNDDVDVFASPDQAADVMLTIDAGVKLVEMSRNGGWVEVGVAQTGKVGWVAEWAVTTDVPDRVTSPPQPAAENDAFARFMVAFNELNRRVNESSGVVFFTSAFYMGDGILHVIATDTWLSGPLADRQSNLDTIYKMWKASQGNDLPVFVNIVDARGNIVMSR